jgi:alpha-glucosidase
MKKILVITNLLTFTVLLFTIGDFSQKEELEPCLYQLENFDFHYKKEWGKPNIIMVGTSLTRHAHWDTLLHRTDIINRGISGNKLRCIVERLAYLKGTSAKICFIEGGIIDLPAQNPDTLVNFYKKIIAFWKSEKVIPVLSLVLYISPKAGINYPYLRDHLAVNTIIRDLNNKTRKYAEENDVDFIDLNKAICDEQRLILKDEYTLDGIHLTESAYKIWAFEIEKILSKHKISNQFSRIESNKLPNCTESQDKYQLNNGNVSKIAQ